MDKIVKNIFLLRHEERTEDPGFNTCLTEKGQLNSKTILDRLSRVGFIPTRIYVSPYIRCLQTAKDISEKLQIRVMVDNSLAEWFNPKDSVDRITTPRKLSYPEIDRYNVDTNYLSFLSYELFPPYENWKSCIDRTGEFLKFLEKKHGNSNDEKILIISHLSVLNAICVNFKHERHSEEMFPMGKLIKLECLTEY